VKWHAQITRVNGRRLKPTENLPYYYPTATTATTNPNHPAGDIRSLGERPSLRPQVCSRCLHSPRRVRRVVIVNGNVLTARSGSAHLIGRADPSTSREARSRRRLGPLNGPGKIKTRNVFNPTVYVVSRGIGRLCNHSWVKKLAYL
jgi:hypothetical protein